MPYQIQQLIEGKGLPICVKKDDPVSKALSLMIEHDYSQLPVVIARGNFDEPEGLITYESIVRGIRNFRAALEDLRVRDVMTAAATFSLEDDVFDVLDRLKETNAVLITAGYEPYLVGIVTSYDIAAYFRGRTEDLMRIEDIELMVKEFVKAAHILENGELDENELSRTVAKVIPPAAKEGSAGLAEKRKTFDDLTLTEYITILTAPENWPFYDPIFRVPRDFVKELLLGIRNLSSVLAHIRGNITVEQRDRLEFGAVWMARCQEEYQSRKQEQERKKLIEMFKLPSTSVETVTQLLESINTTHATRTDFVITEAAISGGRYAALADWLQSQPGRTSQVQLTFNQVEEIIQGYLPASARNHRTWWANDSIGRSHSQLWLEAGWRTTYINLSEGKVTFSRIHERERAYIAFFSKLLEELRSKANFALKSAAPDGTSWLVVYAIPRTGAPCGLFSFSFSRDKRFRIELYLDMGDTIQTKAVFDKLAAQKDRLELLVGAIHWERLENRRASRLAIYRDGLIGDEKKHAELRAWAVDTMIKFIHALQKPAEQAIAEVLS